MGYLTALWVASGVCAHFYEHQGHYLPVLGSLPALGSPWALLIWHCRATLTSITWEQPISLLALVLPCSHYVLVEKCRANQQQQISIKCAQELPEQALGIHWLKNLPPTYMNLTTAIQFSKLGSPPSHDFIRIYTFIIRVVHQFWGAPVTVLAHLFPRRDKRKYLVIWYFWVR